MIRIILIIFIFYANSFSYDKNDIIKDFKNGNFKKICTYGTNHYVKDEDILSLIGGACLKLDNIYPLGAMIRKLVTTPKYRENASYFATILLQKKLIYQFMLDGINLKGLRLPRTSNILSIVFENLTKKNYKTIKGNKIEINDGNKKYILWHSENNSNPPKVFIEEYKDGTLLKTHWYR